MKKEKKDPRFLKRDDLERELVMRDKQALIGDCLKIFDTNTMLFEQVETEKGRTVTLKDEVLKLVTEIDRLTDRSVVSVIFAMIGNRIDRIRNRRKSFNYPMK